jgi:nicotinate-nucleotide--dimethylbenzimidazole phosphoribosyltransferase
MDGYSVNEAAAVLGIPEGRVWELLARGVLSGSTEVGGDMRVFLRGTAVPEPAPHQPNGNGGNGGGELTPFRELLTEFRSLTERYGQALLALGEARGEVASLRGRVDLLEARLDSRSPWTSPSSPTWSEAHVPSPAFAQEADVLERTEPESSPTEPPALVVDEPVAASALPAEEPAATSAPLAEPPIEAEPEPPADEADVLTDVLDATIGAPADEVPPQDEAARPTEAIEVAEPVAPDEPVEPSIGEPLAAQAAAVDLAETVLSDEEPAPRPRPTPRGPAREALEGFAAALARAQDPTTEAVAAEFEELPGSRETAEAVAAYRHDVETGAAVEPPTADRMLEPEPDPEPEPAAVLAPEPVIEPEPAPPPAREPEAASLSVVPSGYSTDTPEPDWIAEEDLIISAGDDSAVRADAMLRLAVAEQAASVPVMADPVARAEPIESADVKETAEPIQMAELEDMAEPIESVEPIEMAEAIPVAGEVSAVEPVTAPEAADDRPAPIESAVAVALAEPEARESEPEPPAVDEVVPEPEPPASPIESRLTPVEIAAEPPAADDEALLAEPPPFAEPPIVPREPAFWEQEAGIRAPFAVEVQHPFADAARGGPARGGPPRAVETTPEPRTVRSDSEPPTSEPRPLSPAAQAGRAAAARNRPRGPAARALRRLRYLLD